MSTASRSVNAAYIRRTREVETQRDELLAVLRECITNDRALLNARTRHINVVARAAIKKATR
jgi:hypothetical protein